MHVQLWFAVSWTSVRFVTMQRFGEKLRSLRNRHGLSLRELSSTLGYASHAYVNAVEIGKKKPTVELVMKVADLFKVTPDQLLQDDQDIPDK